MSQEHCGTIIVIGHPRLPKGPMTMTCMTCRASKSIMASTALTVSQLNKLNKKHMVICWNCFLAARRAGLAQGPIYSTSEGRRILGVHNDRP